MTEFVDGVTLDKYLDSKPVKNISDLKNIFVQIMLGLEHIHRWNIVHRDLKPENIMITPDKKIKIIDFGWGFRAIANIFESDHHRIGTLHYMAPEIINRQEYDYKIDIWSAGVILYELCVGVDPFNGKGEKEIKQKITENIVSYGKIPKEYKEFEEVIKKMLNKKPRKRPDAEDILKEEIFKDAYEANKIKRGKFFTEVQDEIDNYKDPDSKLTFWAFCGEEIKKKKMSEHERWCPFLECQKFSSSKNKSNTNSADAGDKEEEEESHSGTYDDAVQKPKKRKNS